MRINDIIPSLELDVKTYALGVYYNEGNILENPKKSFKLGNVEAFILESNSPEIDDTIFANSTEASKKLYNELLDIDFYFIIYVLDNKVDEMIFAEEVFYSVEEATAFAKNQLIEMNK